ncbi:hypothetical protein ACFRDV_08550 [Streptomyces fagopyri]|uniref:hypothetical protein n=1 Tax=Streptomyces fagopyri TaxID=2662397 RepID=UPI0036CCC0AB
MVVKLAGAAYLAHLAWGMLEPGGRSPFAPAQDLPPVSGFLATRPRAMSAQRFMAGGLLGVFALRTALSRTPVST